MNKAAQPGNLGKGTSQDGAPGILADRIAVVPTAPDPDHAALFLKDLLSDAEAGEALKSLLQEKPDLEGFLLGVIGNSPYLRDLMLADPQRLLRPIDRLGLVEEGGDAWGGQGHARLERHRRPARAFLVAWGLSASARLL